MFSTILLLSYLFNSEVSNEAVIEETTQFSAAKVALIDESVEKVVTDYFSDVPELARVAYCESSFRHFTEEGDVLRGLVDKRDVGVMQINEYYHLDTAEKLGYDIHTLEGNMGYARHLYDKQGLQPWSASSPCWDKMHVATK